MSKPPASSIFYELMNSIKSTQKSIHIQHLTNSVVHNLEFEHGWTALSIHHFSPMNPAIRLPRPLISGLPSANIYVHPDDQTERLAKEKHGEPVPNIKEREWVLPSHIKEKWTLQRFAECFDCIGQEPSDGDNDPDAIAKSALKTRRGGKRLLLATLSDDSTVVYYVVHDGIVKPRQN